MEGTNKVIIAGGRDYNPYNGIIPLKRFLSKVGLVDNLELVSGTAKGADQIPYLMGSGYVVKEFPADWAKNGKAAGYIRNAEMADYADYLVAFWDGNSRGTKNMIEVAKRKGLKVKVFKYE